MKKAIVIIVLLAAIISVVVMLRSVCNDGKTDKKEVAVGMAVEFVDHAASAYIAKNKGWFSEEGILLRSYDTYITGMALAAALAKGDIDVAYICLIPAINAFANAKVPLRIVAGTHKYGYSLVVNTEKIQDSADLERSEIRLGCSAEGSPLDVLMHEMIDQYHLDSKKILSKVRRMPPPNILLALKTGQIDAGFLCEQFPTVGEEMGLRVLLTAQDLWPNMQGSVLVAKEEIIREHPEIVRKIVKVTERGTKYIIDNPQDASKIVASELQIASKEAKVGKAVTTFDITPEVIERSLTTRMDCTTHIDPKQIQKTIDYMARLGYIRESFPASKILHLEFLAR